MTNPTPHGQVPEALQLADEISKAGAFPAYPRAPYEAAAAELRRLHAQVAALTAAPQGVAYAELPEPDATTVGLGAVWNRHSMRDFADRTHALRAPHGQASSQAGEDPALVCDYCGALTPDPWHSSGMLHGKMSKHIHSCDACAARGAAQADSQPAATGRIAELEDALSSCLQLVNQLNEHHIPDGCSRLIRHIKDAAATVSKAQASAPADSVTAPAGGAEEVDKALNDYAQAFMARAMGWTRENGDAMPDTRTKLYSAISSYARGLFTTSPHAPGRQPAPEYVGNGMFKGETIEKAAGHWANWCDRRCMNGLAEFLRVVAARAPADSVLEDAARLDWLALAGPTSICLVIDRPHDGEVEVSTDDVTGYGKTLREALDAARKQGGA